jgi:hypothetical protein
MIEPYSQKETLKLVLRTDFSPSVADLTRALNEPAAIYGNLKQ